MSIAPVERIEGPVERIEGPDAQCLLPSLARLLEDAVHGGASVGFLAPLPAEDAERYWAQVLRKVNEGTRILLAVREGDEVLGAVQLDLDTPPNGRHRAEVQKLFVHTAYRRRGIAKALMAALEVAAREAGRTLLVLDTSGDDAASLYVQLGYLRAGLIPKYALSSGGVLETTQLFYRLLE